MKSKLVIAFYGSIYLLCASEPQVDEIVCKQSMLAMKTDLELICIYTKVSAEGMEAESRVRLQEDCKSMRKNCKSTIVNEDYQIVNNICILHKNYQ